MCAYAQDRLSPDHCAAPYRALPLQQHHLVGFYGERYRLPTAREMPWIQFEYLDIHAVAINAVLSHFTKVSGLRNDTAEGGAISSDLCLGMHTQ